MSNRMGNNIPEETSSANIFKICGIVSLFLLAGFLVVKGFNILLLILAGVMLAVYFRGLAIWLSQRTSTAEGVATILSVVLTFILIFVISWLMGAPLQKQFEVLGENLPVALDHFEEELSETTYGAEIVKLYKEGKADMDTDKIMDVIFGFFKGTFGVIGDFYIILYIGLFFTATPYFYKKGFLSLIPSYGKARADEVLNRLGYTLRNWFAGRIISMFLVFAIVTLGMWIIGMPVPLALGAIAGALNFIPNFGPIIALVPALLIGAANGVNILLLLVIYLGSHLLEGSLITPLIQQRMISISPVLIILGQVIFTLFGGVLGLILATPVMAITMVLVQDLYIEPMEKRFLSKKEESSYTD